jgi:serine/threonine protein kinase
MTSRSPLKNSQYVNVEILGEGSFGKVFKVKDTHDSNKVRAIKRIEIEIIKAPNTNNDSDSKITSSDSSSDSSDPEWKTVSNRSYHSTKTVRSNSDEITTTIISNVIEKTTKISSSIRKTVSRNDEIMVNEAKLLAQLKSSYIIEYVDYFRDENFHYIVTEFANDGDLHKRINHYIKKGKRFSEDIVFFWTTQLLKGIEFLHLNGIIHRDIKPENVFLHDNNIKLGDLGLAREVENISIKMCKRYAHLLGP